MTTDIQNLPSLNSRLDEVTRTMARQMPSEAAALLESFIGDLKERGMVQRSIEKGERVPHFELPNAVGTVISSHHLLARGPLVISFYRGAWCPYCNLELQALNTILPVIRDYGASLVAISPQTPDNSLSLKEKHELDFEVLSDVGNDVARRFGLVFSLSEPMKEFFSVSGVHLPDFNGDESWEIPIPATYVVDQDGVVVAHVDPDWRHRMEPREIIDALKQL